MAIQHPNGFLPLSPIDFSILIVLNRRGVYHGYGIGQEIRSCKLMLHEVGLGQLYRALLKLHAQELIEDAIGQSTQIPTDVRRRNYQITPLGRAVFNAQVVWIETLIRHSRA